MRRRLGNAGALRIIIFVMVMIGVARAASSAKNGNLSSNNVLNYRSSDSTGDSDSKKQALKPYALIFGTVYGPDQRPVSGITVKIRRASDKKPKWERYSDAHGEFAVRVPAGEADYLVWAQVKGRQTSENTEVKVHVDNDERRDVTLHLSN